MQGSTGAQIAPLPHMMSSACVVMKGPQREDEKREIEMKKCVRLLEETEKLRGEQMKTLVATERSYFS